MERPTMARVNRERVLLAGGQRALVMQLAHPLVAAGVAEHSDFPARALERLRRTLDLSLAIIYGTQEEVDRATGTIRAVHDRVSGEGYSANDPALLLWVNATLIDSTMVVYERFVRPLSEDDRRRYYEESVGAAVLFGIPEGLVPPTLDAFRRYLSEMLVGEELRATDASRRLVHDVLHPPLSLPLRLPTAVLRRVTVSLLPEPVRDLFGLRAGAAARAVTGALGVTSRATLPFLPHVVRDFSRARAGLRGYGQ